MTDAPNGSKRFDDLVQTVQRIEIKLDNVSEKLASRPCITHEATLKDQSTRLRDVELSTTRLQAGVQVSAAKVTGLAGIVAAAVAAIGAYFMRGH